MLTPADGLPPVLDFDGLAALLREHLRDGDRFLHLPGNAGDALIALGAHQFFDAHGFRLSEQSYRAPVPDGAGVVFAAAGNFVPLYDHLAGFLAAEAHRLARIVLLPATVRGNETLLGSLPAKTLILCRDMESFRHCRAAAPQVALQLCPDMALFWTPEAHAREFRAALPGMLVRPYAWRYATKAARAFLGARTLRRQGGTLLAMRTDGESAGDAPPPESIDLSEVFRVRENERDQALLAVEALRRFLAPFERVRTNRLHVAVLSALLGKEVVVSDNNYGKLRAVLALASPELRARIRFADGEAGQGSHTPLP
ncbi:MAG: polysaccharide pyruvyl transferase family protein [Pseudomonadota bacterium]